MAIALVSQGTVDAGYTPAFGQATTAGHLLLAWTSTTSNAATFSTTVTGTGWTLVASTGGAFNWTGLWYRANCGAAESAPTFSDPDPNGLFSMLAEFSGAATASPLDRSGAAVNTTVTAGAADAAAAELVVNIARWDGGSAGPVTITDAITDSNSATVSLTVTNNQSSTGTQFYIWGWGITGASLGAAANSATVSLSGQFENTPTQVIASFKNASAKPSGKIRSAPPLAALIAAELI